MVDVATDKAVAIEEEIEREAYNAAFYELGLTWHWDTNTYRRLMDPAGANDPVRIYLETEQSHMLKVYDASFLAGAVQAAKARCRKAMCADGRGMPPKVDWAEIHRAQVGV
jgi:hypothetical protein